jgi:hypothetical protein
LNGEEYQAETPASSITADKAEPEVESKSVQIIEFGRLPACFMAISINFPSSLDDK